MKISILIKTFLMLLISFSLVLLLNMYISYQRFSPLYIEKNIESVKSSILLSITDINNNVELSNTELNSLSSETSFIHYQDGNILEEIGPDFIEESELLGFVISIFDDESTIKENNLMYTVVLNDDIYEINYIYTFETSHYLIISTRIQSLQNIDLVLNEINVTQSVFMAIAIIILSILISLNMSMPLKKINTYAKGISRLDFSKTLHLKRRDEFRDLNRSLNEMTFNLKKTYGKLNEANKKLASDIDYEKQQEEKKKQLIMTINHEIKTPLAVMKGMIEAMIDGIGRYKDKDKYLKELLIQISSIENITQDLTYSLRLEDKMKLDVSTSTSVILNHLEQMDLFAQQHAIKIKKQIALTHINLSEELLVILVSNLVKNAILYSESKIVQVDGSIENNKYVLTIKNKGHIPDEALDKIFDSFYRPSHQKDKVNGSGLGLSIVKQICELYHYTYKIFNDNDTVITKIEIDLK